VYIVGRQIAPAAELERFLKDHGVTWSSDTEIASELLCETAGRVCYMSFARPRPGGNSAYLGHIKESGHGSVLEHAVWNLLVTGVSRSLTHELIRHRAGMGYSQLSQRYVDESVAEYVEPDIIGNDPELHQLWLDTVEHAHRGYCQLAEKLAQKIAQDPKCRDLPATDRRKAARQAARSVLPNATETKIFVTANARALRHFMEMRGSRHAEPEIRLLANEVCRIMQKEAPNIFGDYRMLELPDGTFEIETDYRKV
jgi:thymidylate synthase (FAD)